jgi:hypothetical protein
MHLAPACVKNWETNLLSLTSSTPLERFPERKRETFLSPKELQRLGHTLTAAELDRTQTKYAAASAEAQNFGTSFLAADS